MSESQHGDAVYVHSTHEINWLGRFHFAFWILLGSPIRTRVVVETEHLMGRTDTTVNDVWMGALPWWPHRSETAMQSELANGRQT